MQTMIVNNLLLSAQSWFVQGFQSSLINHSSFNWIECKSNDLQMHEEWLKSEPYRSEKKQASFIRHTKLRSKLSGLSKNFLQLIDNFTCSFDFWMQKLLQINFATFVTRFYVVWRIPCKIDFYSISFACFQISISSIELSQLNEK